MIHAFIKKDTILLKSKWTGHVYIYLTDENEYKYLKALGVEFYEKNLYLLKKIKEYLVIKRLSFIITLLYYNKLKIYRC